MTTGKEPFAQADAAGDREECLAPGMDDYATKPIRVDALVQAPTETPVRKTH